MVANAEALVEYECNLCGHVGNDADDFHVWPDEGVAECNTCREADEARAYALYGPGRSTVVVDDNAGYEWGNYKNTAYMDSVFDAH